MVVYHFSEDSRNIEKVRSNTSSGAYTINDTVVQMLNNELPFGGVGKSGYGRFHGKSGFTAFSNPKSICKTMPVNSFPLNVRFPPYTESKKSLMTKLLKFGSITYSQIFKVVIGSILLISLIVFFLLYLPEIMEKKEQ